MPPPREQPGPRSRRRQDTMPGGWLWIVVLLLLALVMWVTVGTSNTGTIEYSDFLALVKAGKVSKVTFREGSHTLTAEIDKAAKVEDLTVSQEAQQQLARTTKVVVQYWT